MGFSIGPKVRKKFLTQNEQKRIGLEKGRSEFDSNKKFSKRIADYSDAVKSSTQQGLEATHEKRDGGSKGEAGAGAM